ncbi:MAG: CD225/dispanin family protein [Rikenellaceae bacterium]
MEEKSFFYIDTLGRQQGPRSIQQLANEGVISPNTMVWCQGMKDWGRAGDIEELQALCMNHPQEVEQQAIPPLIHTTPTYVSEEKPKEPSPHSWLIESILSTFLCCPITGIIGIIYASKVEELWTKGLYSEARSAANTAKILFIVGMSLLVVSTLGYLIIMLAAVGAFLPGIM